MCLLRKKLIELLKIESEYANKRVRMIIKNACEKCNKKADCLD